MRRPLLSIVFGSTVLTLTMSAALAGNTQYTLASGQYTHYTIGPLGCPKLCKDGFYFRIDAPVGKVITKISIVDRTPHSNNHWYRCQAEIPCGFEEFSDVTPGKYNVSCYGTPSCLVWRATDGSNGNEQDILDVQWN
jgi:hypothetical protein